MGPARKPTPERYCAYCGKKLERKDYPNSHECVPNFLKRKYCSRECMRKAFIKVGESDQNIKSAHATSRKIPFAIDGKERKCEICGRSGECVRIEVHHIDKNWQNNNPDNLQVLCAQCHKKIHNSERETPKCKVCGKECKRLHHGMCGKHYLQWRRNGDPLHEPWSTYKEKKSKGPVYVYDKSGNLIATYQDIRTASKETGFARSSVASACNTPNKTLGGYIWRYAETIQQE